MTHDELLTKINKEMEFSNFSNACGEYDADYFLAALRAVVELHKPDEAGFCGECFGTPYVTYPCSTIQAIEKELG